MSRDAGRDPSAEGGPDDWDHRSLCPDGACTGVIGDDGLCKTCGRAATNWGDERQRGLVVEAPPPSATAAAAPAPADDSDAYEWSRRQLCPDDACVGVLGSDDRCKVCGRSAGA